MNVDVLDQAFFVDNEDRPFGGSHSPKNAVLLANLPMRPEVAEEGILYPLEGICPGFQGRNMVDADAQHLGIQSREPGGLRLVSRDLRASGWGEGQGEKG